MEALPRAKIESILAGLDGRAGLYIHDLSCGEKLMINEREPFVSASVIKLPILLRLLWDAELGLVDLAAPRTIAPENRVGGSGVLQALSPTVSLSLWDLAVLMIIYSDNNATNELIDVAGIQRVDALCRELGLTETTLQRKMMDLAARAAGWENYTSAADMGRLLEGVASGDLVSPALCERATGVLLMQRLNDCLPALLPAIPHGAAPAEAPLPPEGRVFVAHKTGGLAGIKHDCGFLILPDGRRVVIAMLTAAGDKKASALCIAGVARAVYDRFSEEKLGKRL